MDAGQWYLEVNGKKVGPFTLDQIQGFLEDGEIRPYHQVTSPELAGKWLSVEELLQSQQPPPPPSDDLEPVTMNIDFEFADPTSVAVVKPAPVAEPVFEPELEPVATPASTPAPYVPPANYDANFQPPPRPEIQNSAPIHDKTDPALSLFNALQVLRERRSATIQPPSVKSSGPSKPLFKMPNVKMPSVKLDLDAIKASIGTPARMWIAAGFAGLVLGGLTWGMAHYLRSHAKPGPGTLTQMNGAETARKPWERPNQAPQAAYPEAPRRVIPPPPPPPVHIAPPMTRPGFENNIEQPQNGYPPPENNNPPPEQNNYPPPEQNNYPPPEQQGQPDAGGGGMGGGENPNPANVDPNAQQPQGAPGQDNFPPPPQQ